MRCMALAETFQNAGWCTKVATRRATLDIMQNFLNADDCILFDEDLPQREAEAIGNALNTPCDLMVIDHYGLDRTFETATRGYSRSVLAIDDLADRQHDCDWLLDQGGTRQSQEYEGLLPPTCKLLLGPQYAMLRHEFLKHRISQRRTTGAMKRILVSLGATDPDGLALRVLDGIAVTKQTVGIDIVAAESSPHLDALRQRIETLPDNQSPVLHLDTSNMSALMETADLAIGAGGMTSLERCCLGLPTLIIIVADNQKDNAKALAKAGAAVILGDKHTVTTKTIADNISSLTHDSETRQSLSRAASGLCDGLGTRRIRLRIASGEIARDGQPVSLRPATMADTEMIFTWQVAAETRAFARNPEPPTRDEHNAWMARCISDDAALLNIVLHDEVPSGVLRLDRRPSTNGSTLQMEVSIYVAPGHYRMGIAQCALSLACKLVPEAELLAEILPGNVASQALFQKAGFTKDDDLYHLAAHA